MISIGEIVLRLTLAAVLGSIVGFERERLDKAAGIRTHMLVGMGSCLFMIISAYGFQHLMRTGFPGMPDSARISFDPSRIAAQIVSGIGFLGAGTILFKRDTIRGLTTAAGMWAVAAVGMAIGGGLYLEAAIATILTLIILAGVKPLEKKLFYKRHFSLFIIEEHHAEQLSKIQELIEAEELVIKDLLVKKLDKTGREKLILTLEQCDKSQLIKLISKIKSLSNVQEVSFQEH